MLDSVVTDLEIVLKLRGLEAFLGDIMDISDRLKELQNNLTKLGLSFADFIKGAAGIALMIGSFGLLKKAIKDASELQPFRIAMKNFLGGTEKDADALIGKLRNFSLKSPFAFHQVRESTQMMLAMGFKPEELERTLGIVGSLTAMSGDQNNFARITLALSQMRNKTTLSMEELNRQLVNSGVPGPSIMGRALAKKLNITFKDAMNQIQTKTHGLSGEESYQLFMSEVENDPKYKNALKEFAASLPGQLMKLDNLLLFMSQDIGSSLVPALTAVLTPIAAFASLLNDLNGITGGKGGAAVLIGIFVLGLKMFWKVGMTAWNVLKGLNSVLQQITVSGSGAAAALKAQQAGQLILPGMGVAGVSAVAGGGGLKGWLKGGGMKTMGAGIGGFIALMAGNMLLSQWQPNTQTTGGKWQDVLKSSLGGALNGAAIGALFSPIGAAIGAGIGLLGGAAFSLYSNFANQGDGKTNPIDTIADNSNKQLAEARITNRYLAGMVPAGVSASGASNIDSFFNNNLRRGIY